MTEEERRIDSLIIMGMDVNEKYLGHPHLINMCIEGNIEYVEKLIKNGADINYETKDGWTPLSYAIFSQKANLVEVLIQNGADVNYEIKGGLTPLTEAIGADDANLVELLIKNGADVNHVTKY